VRGGGEKRLPFGNGSEENEGKQENDDKPWRKSESD